MVVAYPAAAVGSTPHQAVVPVERSGKAALRPRRMLDEGADPSGVMRLPFVGNESGSPG